MAAIQHLLQRLGFVKLGRFGLVLTPEGRILSIRPAVLDDGAGGRIVGWQDGDLAMAELQPWEPARPATRRAARRAATAQAAVPVMPSRSHPVAAHVTQPMPSGCAQSLPPPSYQAVISEASVLALRPRAESEPAMAAPAMAVPAMAVHVAPEPTVDEDDWEWTIALARARASAEEAVSPATPEPVSTRATPEPEAPRTRPMPAAPVMAKDPATSGEWPATEPIGAIDYDSRTATRPAMVIPRIAPTAPPAMPHAAAPVTVIPVPVLPTMHNTAHAGRLAPVVRTTAVHAAASSRARFPKGTGPVSPRTTTRMAAMPDDTDPSVNVGDRTTPGIALPPAARAVSLPSIKRRTFTR